MPTQFDRAATRGRTGPLFITCELDDASPVEVVAKFSRGCEQGNVNLAREVVAACLAGDLGLPVPEPFLIQVQPGWAEAIPEEILRRKVLESSPIAFGSRRVEGPFNTWGSGNQVSDAMLNAAAAIFAFDGISQNPDRRSVNPNCLVLGDELRIFDHDLAFAHRLIIGWREPWNAGGLHSFEAAGAHIFRAGLVGRVIDFDLIRAAWAGLSNDMIDSYTDAIPPEWDGAAAEMASAIDLIRGARDNIDACLEEVKRVLR